MCLLNGRCENKVAEDHKGGKIVCDDCFGVMAFPGLLLRRRNMISRIVTSDGN